MICFRSLQPGEKQKKLLIFSCLESGFLRYHFSYISLGCLHSGSWWCTRKKPQENDRRPSKTKKGRETSRMVQQFFSDRIPCQVKAKLWNFLLAPNRHTSDGNCSISLFSRNIMAFNILNTCLDHHIISGM